MEVHLGKGLNYGFSYLQAQPSTLGRFTGIGAGRTVDFLNGGNFIAGLGSNVASVASVPSGFSYFANFLDFEATAVAIANDSRVNVISRPRIQTSHAVEANLFVGNT